MQKRNQQKNIIIAVVAIIVLIMGLTGCNSNRYSVLNWPNSGISTVLPVPNSEQGTIHSDRTDYFSADIENMSADSYREYLAKCKEAGFTIDAREKTNTYSAYNSDGYKLDISYFEYSSEFSIRLDAPKTYGTFVYPATGLATMLPTPKSNVGTIQTDSSKRFAIYVAETSIDDYDSYVNSCIAKGFNVDYNKDSYLYTAQNEDGYSIRIEYEGFNTMYICIYVPEEESSEPIEEESEISTVSEISEPSTVSKPSETSKVTSTVSEPPQQSTTSGIRPKFKETMDSYEAFFDEYIEFMELYANSDDPLSLTLQYLDYLERYADMMEKMEELSDEEMSDAEAIYYTEVTMRIYQKMANMNM